MSDNPSVDTAPLGSARSKTFLEEEFAHVLATENGPGLIREAVASRQTSRSMLIAMINLLVGGNGVALLTLYNAALPADGGASIVDAQLMGWLFLAGIVCGIISYFWCALSIETSGDIALGLAKRVSESQEKSQETNDANISRQFREQSRYAGAAAFFLLASCALFLTGAMQPLIGGNTP